MAKNLTNSQVNVIPHNHPISDITNLQSTLNNKADTSSVPTKVSDLTNDSGFITGNDVGAAAKSNKYSDLDGKPVVDATMSDDSTNAVQNKIIKKYVDTKSSSAAQGAVSDTSYASSWDGVTGVAPSKNAVYDKINAMDSTISGKQNTISDLATIRSGASAGATALQPSAISNTAYATTWNGDSTHAPSKDAVYDKIESVISSIPTNTNQLTNGAGFITNTANNLTNYYTKSDTYTKTEVNNLINSFGGFEVVSTLPTQNIKTNVIYLLGPIGTGTDKYQEWIYTTEWVLIGDTSVDLTNYVTSTQLSTQLATKQDKATSGAGAPTAKPSYVGQIYVDTTNMYVYTAYGTSSSNDWHMDVGLRAIVITEANYNNLSNADKNSEVIWLVLK